MTLQSSMAALALAATSQEWRQLGQGEDLASKDFDDIVDRITAILLVRIVAVASPMGKHHDLSTTSICRHGLFTGDPWPEEISEKVVDQLRKYVQQILKGYRPLPYHNQEHAHHVVISANRLVDLMLNADNYGRKKPPLFGLRHDTLLQLAVLFAALIHDVNHEGVSNHQLARECHPMSMLYNDTSTLEQISLAVAFRELLKDQYEDLRQVMFKTKEEYRRFRKTVVDLVLATDISNPDRLQLAKDKWKSAFETDIEEPKVEQQEVIHEDEATPPSTVQRVPRLGIKRSLSRKASMRSVGSIIHQLSRHTVPERGQEERYGRHSVPQTGFEYRGAHDFDEISVTSSVTFRDGDESLANASLLSKASSKEQIKEVKPPKFRRGSLSNFLCRSDHESRDENGQENPYGVTHEIPTADALGYSRLSVNKFEMDHSGGSNGVQESTRRTRFSRRGQKADIEEVPEHQSLESNRSVKTTTFKKRLSTTLDETVRASNQSPFQVNNGKEWEADNQSLENQSLENGEKTRGASSLSHENGINTLGASKFSQENGEKTWRASNTSQENGEKTWRASNQSRNNGLVRANSTANGLGKEEEPRRNSITRQQSSPSMMLNMRAAATKGKHKKLAQNDFQRKPVARQNSSPALLHNAMLRRFQHRMSVASADKSRKFKNRLNIRKSMDLSGETVENFANGAHLRGMTEAVEAARAADKPDELKACVVMETLLLVSDVAFYLQSSELMSMWSKQLYLEMEKSFQDGRGLDPSVSWYENQAGLLQFYVTPLAEKLEDMGIFGSEVGPTFLEYVESNRDWWIANGFEFSNSLSSRNSARHAPCEKEGYSSLSAEFKIWDIL